LTDDRRRHLLERAAALLREPLRLAESEAILDGYRALLTVDVRSELSGGWWGLQRDAAAWTGGEEMRGMRKNCHVSVDSLSWVGFGLPPAHLQALD